MTSRACILSVLWIAVAGCDNTDSEVADEIPAKPEPTSVEVPPSNWGMLRRGRSLGARPLSKDADSATGNDQTDVGRSLRLAPGDTAPPLNAAVTVRGPKLRPFDDEHAVLAVFWSSWNPACSNTLSSISKLQERFGSQVQCVGITDESEKLLTEFLSEQQDGIPRSDMVSCTVALDDEQKTFDAYMKASGLHERPTAFLIDTSGTIAWIGPAGLAEEPLNSVIDGTWQVGPHRNEFLISHTTTTLADDQRLPPVSALEPGMSAPELQLGDLLHGEPVTQPGESGRIKVVEFAATWCSHSQIAIQSLTSIQNTFAGAVEIVSVYTEDTTAVTSWLNHPSPTGQDWAGRINYSIAVDDQMTTWRSYMEAANRHSLPCAFVLNATGRVAWIGNPRNLSGPLQQIVSGVFGIRNAAIAERSRQAMALAAKSNDEEKMENVLMTFTELVPENLQIRFLQLNRFQQTARVNSYNQAARRIIEDFGNSPMAMNNIAWIIATELDQTERDLDLAMKAAVLANEYTGHQDGNILDTLARVHYEQGDLQEATRWQRLAFSKIRNSDTVGALQRYTRELAAQAAEQ